MLSPCVSAAAMACSREPAVSKRVSLPVGRMEMSSARTAIQATMTMATM